MKKISLVFMVAGLSSRFGGKAKGLVEVGPKGEVLLEYSLDQALKNDFFRIILIVSKKTEKQYESYFGAEYKGVPIEYIIQEFDERIRERPWGTTDALCSARDLIDGPFVVCNGDDIYGEDVFRIIFNHLMEKETDVTLGYRLGKVLPKGGNANRGIFELDEKGNVKTIVENIGIGLENLKEKGLTEESLCSMNLFGLNLKTFELLNEALKKFKRRNYEDRKIECYLPKELGILIFERKIVMDLYPTDDKWFGLTNPEDEEVIREELRKE